MKKLPQLSVSLLLGAVALTSCSTNKMAVNSQDDNLYFRASDVQVATQYAVENNNPSSFQNLGESSALTQENFSSRNVNPEYISRYSATSEEADAGTVYFDEAGDEQVSSTGNINAYDNFYSNANGSNGFSSPNINFNFGLGFGYGFSPYGYGFYDPFWGSPWGYRPGLSWNIGFGWGYPSFGLGFGSGWGWGPSFGWGYPMYPSWGYPIYGGYPSYILPGPGGEYGSRRIVSGARPTRGSSLANMGSTRQASMIPSTARAQNRATASNPSARRIAASENSRVATRDFSNSQNDYYNSNRSRVVTSSRNLNSPATDRAVNTRSRSSIPSARPSTVNPGSYSRSTAAPSGSRSYDNFRSNSPSYNRSSSPSYNRSTSPSYNNNTRSTSPSYNRSMTPSRSSDTGGFSAPSRSSSGSSGFSAPSRSSGGSSGMSSGGSRGGRGN